MIPVAYPGMDSFFSRGKGLKAYQHPQVIHPFFSSGIIADHFNDPSSRPAQFAPCSAEWYFKINDEN